MSQVIVQEASVQAKNALEYANKVGLHKAAEYVAKFVVNCMDTGILMEFVIRLTTDLTKAFRANPEKELDWKMNIVIGLVMDRFMHGKGATDAECREIMLTLKDLPLNKTLEARREAHLEWVMMSSAERAEIARKVLEGIALYAKSISRQKNLEAARLVREEMERQQQARAEQMNKDAAFNPKTIAEALAAGWKVKTTWLNSTTMISSSGVTKIVPEAVPAKKIASLSPVIRTSNGEQAVDEKVRHAIKRTHHGSQKGNLATALEAAGLAVG